MRIFLHGLPLIALTALLAASLSQGISQSLESSSRASHQGTVLPEVTAILLKSRAKSQKRAGLQQQWRQIQAEQETQQENLLNAF